MKKYVCIIILFFFCTSAIPQTNNSDLKNGIECETTGYITEFTYPILLDKHSVYILSDEEIIDDDDECRDTKTNYLRQGIAPIVLYYSDISQLKIKEIEINDSIDRGGEYFPYTFDVNFDKMGLFNSFSLYLFYNRVELLHCFMQSNLPTIGQGEYLYPFDDIQLNFHISSSLDRDDYRLEYLSKIKILPFCGKNGYVYVDYQVDKNYVIDGNVITYKMNDYEYGILKKIQSDTINVEIYEVADKELLTPLISRLTINKIQKDSSCLLFYYYGESPYSTYYTDRSSCIDEGIVIARYYNTYYADTVYNRNRWIGFADENFSIGEHCTNRRDLFDCKFETEIINETFSNQNVTKVSKKDFLINGQNGYDYLLTTYNNRKVLVKERYEDENGNSIPAEYKFQKEIAEIQELPDKIIVQLTLTDFWYIKLTE
jgi:hypothetical protein